VDIACADCACVILESAGQCTQNKAEEELGLDEHVDASLFVTLQKKDTEDREVGEG
jgi:ferredoxin